MGPEHREVSLESVKLADFGPDSRLEVRTKHTPYILENISGTWFLSGGKISTPIEVKNMAPVLERGTRLIIVAVDKSQDLMSSNIESITVLNKPETKQ